MGRAFRSDVLEAEPIANEIAELARRMDIMPAEMVRCPMQDCNVTYSMDNYMFSDRQRNLETLNYGLRIHHPHHPAKFVLNEPRAD